ncbi:MAG: hypothetical protein ACR2GH_02400 [Pseudonocardia sp.]
MTLGESTRKTARVAGPSRAPRRLPPPQPRSGDHSWINHRFGSQRLDHTLVSPAAGETRTCAYNHTTRTDQLSDHAALLTTSGPRPDLIEQDDVDTQVRIRRGRLDHPKQRCPGSNPAQRGGLVGHLALVVGHNASREIVHHSTLIVTYHRHL